MEIVLISLFLATLMPILAKAPLALEMHKLKGYDNRNPRQQQDQLQGFGARCKAAHYNSFEALIMYIPGALAVVAVDAVTQLTEYYAMGFVFARFCYLLMYWLDQHVLRSLFWGVGFIISLLMLWQAMAMVATW
ncbi:MAPEG family protein [Planctobacterium marinum]|uniref:Membrane protein n=1 Tax=Planctobacterium marinum TaxID=1631968 RepID=A0AA48HNA4_9ALTE|nr:membrane protein [Planctobacterium marinum]